MKIVFIVIYFGKLPNYFDLFLKSCEANRDFEWIIFTDDRSDYNYPNNVKKIDMNFEECKKIFQSKFDFKISLENPQKLCDFKPSYGYVLQEYIKEYDFWGHCDIDLVFGNLKKFITPELLKKYDKLFTLGHLTIYRNNDYVNKQFMNQIKGIYRYKEVFSNSSGFGFDEWIDINVNDIFYESDLEFLDTAIGADLDPYNTKFILVWYDKNQKKYCRENKKDSIFEWDNGNLYRIYEKQNKIKKEEFPYVHFQKRSMNVKSDCIDMKKYFISPNCFFVSDEDVKLIITKSKLKSIINYQYIRVKWKSLKLRIKTKNFKFSNVFR